MQRIQMRQPLPLFIKLWFGADLVLALLPPLHWAAGSGASLFGIPAVLVYFFGSGLFVTTSVLAAFVSDPNRRQVAER